MNLRKLSLFLFVLLGSLLAHAGTDLKKSDASDENNYCYFKPITRDPGIWPVFIIKNCLSNWSYGYYISVLENHIVLLQHSNVDGEYYIRIYSKQSQQLIYQGHVSLSL